MVMEGIQVQGSVGVLKGLSDAAGQLSIDLEDELSKKLGDPIAGAMLMGARPSTGNSKPSRNRLNPRPKNIFGTNKAGW